jgi:hypothetical protein
MTITIIEVESLDGVIEHAIIEHADGSFTSMPKAVYDAQQVEHLTEIPTN